MPCQVRHALCCTTALPRPHLRPQVSAHTGARVQEQAVPEILAGRDVALAAETGSGKTLAYLLPVIASLRQRKAGMRADRPDAPECALTPRSPCCALMRSGRAHAHIVVVTKKKSRHWV